MRCIVRHMTTLSLVLIVLTCGWSMDAVRGDPDQMQQQQPQEHQSEQQRQFLSAQAGLDDEREPFFWGLAPSHLQSMNVNPDQDTLNYLLPKLRAKYRSSDAWLAMNDPRYYDVSELSDENQNSDLIRNDKLDKRDGKLGRNGPSLSIVQPLDVLRQRMLLEIARRKAIQQVKQVQANREYLENIGKRSGFGSQQVQSRNLLQYDAL